MRSSRISKQALKDAESRAAISQAIRNLYVQAASSPVPSTAGQWQTALQNTLRWSGLESAQLQGWAGGLVQQIGKLPQFNYFNCQNQVGQQFQHNFSYQPFITSQQQQSCFSNFAQFQHAYNQSVDVQNQNETFGLFLGASDNSSQARQQLYQQQLLQEQKIQLQQQQHQLQKLSQQSSVANTIQQLSLTDQLGLQSNDLQHRDANFSQSSEEEINLHKNQIKQIQQLSQLTNSAQQNCTSSTPSNSNFLIPYNFFPNKFESKHILEAQDFNGSQSYSVLTSSNEVSPLKKSPKKNLTKVTDQQRKKLDFKFTPEGIYKRENYFQNNAFQINRRIMQSQTICELSNIVNEDQTNMNFINISSALARIPKIVQNNQKGDEETQNLIKKLLQMMQSMEDQFDARGLANVTWTLGKLEFHPGNQFLELMCKHAESKISEFNPQNLANFMWALVYLGHRNQKLAKSVKDRALICMHKFGSQQLSNLAWAYANSEYYYPDLFSAICERAVKQLYQFNEQEIANLVWSCATLNHFDEFFCYFVTQEVSQRISEFAPQGVSNLVWSFATLNYFNLNFLNCAAWRMAHCAHYATPQALSNIVWGFAVFKYRDVQILNILVDQCWRKIDQFSAQNISNLFWSLAVLDFRHEKFVQDCGPWVSQILLECSEQGLCNVAWAYATLQFYDTHVLNALTQISKKKLNDVAPQGLSILPWSFASLEHWDEELFNQIADQSITQIQHFQDQNFSNLAWSFMHIGHYHKGLFDCLLEKASFQLSEFSIQSVLNMVQSFAKLRHPLGKFKGQYLNFFDNQIEKMGEMELCMTAWSLALLDELTPEMLQKISNLVLKQPHVSIEGLQQLMHAQLALNSKISLRNSKYQSQYFKSSSNFLSEMLKFRKISPCAQNFQDQITQKRDLEMQDEFKLPEELRVLAMQTWKDCADRVTVSNFQREVFDVMNRAGYHCQMETLTDDGLFSIDVTCTIPNHPQNVSQNTCIDGKEQNFQSASIEMKNQDTVDNQRVGQQKFKKVAVEVDGVHHFTRNSPRRALGDSVLRNRMLAERGWNVVVVPFYLWNDFDGAQQEDFLTRLINYATSDQPHNNYNDMQMQDLVFRAFAT